MPLRLGFLHRVGPADEVAWLGSERTARLFEETKKRGLLIGKGGLAGNAIRISPPLTVSESEVDEALGIFRESFEAMGA